MLESKQVLAYDDASKTFAGVRFLLLGFDSIEKNEVRSKLLEGGGVDAVNYGSDCTHVIVDKLVYDEPICVAARKDGKTLVTGLWVDHSFDVRMPVDPTSVMYWPMRDLNGIPGAKSMVVCLTGYQRQDRDDIMNMVALMGANFSKPLVANKVTHLICYKFEGEKYELAKKMKKIKLVNHRWLEDCLKAWEILPEADYCKSGYELEMEAEAKDSEEDTEDIASILNVGKKNAASPQNNRAENKRSHQSPEVSRNSLNLSASKSLGNFVDISNIHTTTLKNIDFKKTLFSRETHLEMPSPLSSKSRGKLSSEVPSSILDTKMFAEKVENVSTSASESAKKSPNDDVSKLSRKSYFRSSPGKTSLPFMSERIENNSGSPSASNVNKLRVSGGFDATDCDGVKTHLNRKSSHIDGEASLACKDDLNISAVSEDRQVCNEEALQSSLVGLKKRPFSNLNAKDPSSGRTGNFTGGIEVHQSDVQSTELPHPLTDIPGEEKMDGSDLNLANMGNAGSKLKPLKTKMLAKKTLGSRPTTRKGSTIKNKGSLSLQKDILPNEYIVHSIGGRNSGKSQDKGLNEFEPGNDKDEQIEIESGNISRDKSVGIVHKKKQAGEKNKSMKEKLAKSVEIEKGDEIQKAVNKTELAESKSTAGEKKITKDRKHSSTKSVTTKSNVNREDVEKDLSNSKQNENKIVSGHEETKKRPLKKLTCSTEENEKGNEAEKGIDETKFAEPKSTVGEQKLTKGKKRSSTKSMTNKSKYPREDAERDLSNSNEDTKKRPLKKLRSSTEENERGNEAENGIDETEFAKSKSTVGEQKLSKGKKRSSTKSMTNKSKDPREDAEKDGSNRKEEENKLISGNEETVAIARKTKTRPSKKLKSSNNTENDKNHESVSNDTGTAGKLSSPPSKKPLKKGLKTEKATSDSLRDRDFEVKTEPAWFIVSGHKLQRKEFQQVIRRLKGRVCRDSHNWSYQATHFIVPDPIRRTEKFFAASASGSWILKTDYLTACNDAGGFLSEEPYEWHKKCLTEDGAINLEAPRKWRLLRERTGHGAFYGMRIVIYGECIAPPLDTLKRVVKAGDGTILATSPPYTRFLQSRIDFAIISPGMPRVDMWVQEFLRHEVPCAAADYLVEYVCKPGYSLEKHVLYNTHAWAKKSLENHVTRVEEVVEDVRTPKDDSNDDVACEVCGCRDREEEMLICGDEKGNNGCGVGIHLDCLDPPLEDVPEEDWFCQKCSKKKTSKSISKSANKRVSKSKR